MKEKSILNSPFYKVLRYGYYFLVTNLLFLFANLPFFLIFFSVPLLIENVFWYAIALVPAGPAFASLFFTMGLLIREKEIAPVKDFFRGYRSHFWLSLKFWLIQLGVLVILGVDVLHFFADGTLLTSILFGIGLILAAFITLSGFSIMGVFEITLPNVYRSAVVMLWNYWTRALLNLLTILSFMILLYAFPGELFLFLFSLTIFYLMRNSQPVFDQMEKRFSSEKSKEEESHAEHK